MMVQWVNIPTVLVKCQLDEAFNDLTIDSLQLTSIWLYICTILDKSKYSNGAFIDSYSGCQEISFYSPNKTYMH